MKKDLKIVFATPSIAATVLAELIQHHSIVGVYTQPDRVAGRGQKLMACPVKQWAEQHQLPVFQPKSLRSSQAQATLAALKPDILIVVAYGLLLPKAVLDLPRYGCLNVHVSLLPRWRGAAPIQRALLHGDKQTGVSIMQMDEGLDTGDILLQTTCEISQADTAASLHDKLSVLGADTLLEVLGKLDQLKPQKQDDTQSCYAEKIQKSEGQIDWQAPAEYIDRMIRAFNPWPGTFTSIGGQLLKIWQAVDTGIQSDKAPGTIVQAAKQGLDIATGSTLLRVTHCQLAGGKMLAIADLLNAKKQLFAIGRQL